MNTIVIAWVLVVSASTNQNSPIISPLVADLASCERMQRAVEYGSGRSTQCVEVKVLK
jgi:hypothetical protein